MKFQDGSRSGAVDIVGVLIPKGVPYHVHRPHANQQLSVHVQCVVH